MADPLTNPTSSTRPDLAALGAELQGELRLVDWEVVYAYVADLCDEVGNLVYGLCDRLVDNKTATIRIRDPFASQPLPAGAEDKSVESILMHELVHLHVAPLAQNTPTGITAEEQAVWPIADALARWRGTARGEMVARAMVLRAPQRVAPKRESKKMDRASLAMLDAALGGKDPEAAIAGAKAWAKAAAEGMGDDKPKDGDAPAETEEAKAARLARAAETEKTEREAAAAKARAEVPPPPKAAAAMTLADVRREAQAIVGEFAERAALITTNADVLGAAEQVAWSTLPLATVKTLVAARRMAVAAASTSSGRREASVGPVRVGPAGGASSSGRVLEPDDVEDTQRALRIIAKRFGTAPASAAPPIQINKRGMYISNVSPLSLTEFLSKQQADASGAR